MKTSLNIKQLQFCACSFHPHIVIARSGYFQQTIGIFISWKPSVYSILNCWYLYNFSFPAIHSPSIFYLGDKYVFLIFSNVSEMLLHKICIYFIFIECRKQILCELEQCFLFFNQWYECLYFFFTSFDICKFVAFLWIWSNVLIFFPYTLSLVS